MNKTIYREYRWKTSVALSLGIHFLAWLLLPDLREKSSPKQKNLFEVERLDPQSLKKYRTVGIKDGVKEFSIPIPEKPLSLRSLQVTGSSPRSPSKKNPFRQKREKLPNQYTLAKKESWASRSRQIVESEEKKILRQFGFHPSSKDILQKSLFNVNFAPPEGVDEDELNSTEKIFWSFQKRCARSYISSFLKTYHRFALERPQILKALRDEKHFISGSIDFDRDGNIVKIKIIRPSINDDFHDLFEQTLKQIYKLPNPPQKILKDDQFTIYYQLKINT